MSAVGQLVQEFGTLAVARMITYSRLTYTVPALTYKEPTMNINNAFPSKWLKSGDLEDGDLTLTIKSVEQEEVGQGEDAEQKPIVHFQEVEKGMVLNKTNANTISSLYGPETDGWVGKKISLFSTEVDFGGKQTLAIRIRMKKAVGVSDMKEIWTKFCKANGVTEAHIRGALGTPKVSEWIAAEVGRTLAGAMELVQATAADF